MHALTEQLCKCRLWLFLGLRSLLYNWFPLEVSILIVVTALTKTPANNHKDYQARKMFWVLEQSWIKALSKGRMEGQKKPGELSKFQYPFNKAVKTIQ